MYRHLLHILAVSRGNNERKVKVAIKTDKNNGRYNKTLVHPLTLRLMPQAEVLVECDGEVRGKRKAIDWYQQESGPEGDTIFSGPARESSCQMDHRTFQVLSAEYRIQL